MKDTLLSEPTRQRSASSVFPLMPDVIAIQLGGKIIDGGRKTLLPVLEEIRTNLKNRKMIIATSSGERSKHVVAVASDLGLPVGLVAELKRLDAELNAHIVEALLSPYGIPELSHAEMIHVLPAMLEVSRAVVFNGVPPYDIWERPPLEGREPPTGPDVGVFLFSLTCGMREVVYVRDVDGIYTDDPKLEQTARLIPQTNPSDLLKSFPPTSCVDREVFELQERSRRPMNVSVVNGLATGMLSSVLKGGAPGTLVSV
jgi:molybdenum storage protein